MLTNKQLAELVTKEVKFLSAEIYLFAGDITEPEDATPDTYKWMRDDRVQVRTDRMYWLAKKFPELYRQAWWSLAELRPDRPEKGPAITGRKIRMIG